MKFDKMVLNYWVNIFTKIVVVFLFFLPPLIFAPLWSDWYTLPKYLTVSFFATLFIILTGVTLLLDPHFLFPRRILILLMLFVSIVTISTIFSLNPVTSFLPRKMLYTNHTMHTLILILLVISIYIFLRKNKDKKIELISFSISAGLLLVSISSLGFLIDSNFQLSERIRGTEGEPNRLGLYLAASLPVALSQIFIKQRINKVIGIVSGVFGFLTLILTYSRGAWISLLFASIVMFNLHKDQIINRLRKRKVNFAHLGFFLIVIITCIFLFGRLVFFRLSSLKEDMFKKTGSMYLRLISYNEAFNLYKDQSWIRKVIGLGPNSAAYLLNKYRNLEVNKLIPHDQRLWRNYYVRNQYIQIILDMGLIGIISYLVILWFSFKNYISKRTRFSYESTYFWLFLVILFEGFIYYQTILTSLLFWLSISILWSSNNVKIRISSKAIPLFFICLGIFFLIYTVLYGMSDYFAAKKQYSKAIRLMPWQSEYYSNWSRMYIEKTYIDQSRQSVITAIKLGEESLRLDSLEMDNLNSAQLAYYKAGVIIDKNYLRKSLDIAKKCLLLDPARPQSYDKLGLVYLDLGETEKAKSFFTKAIEIDPDYIGSYLHIGEIYKQHGLYNEAKFYYQIANNKDPDSDISKNELNKLEKIINGIKN